MAMAIELTDIPPRVWIWQFNIELKSYGEIVSALEYMYDEERLAKDIYLALHFHKR